jgi:hypothetical protein
LCRSCDRTSRVSRERLISLFVVSEDLFSVGKKARFLVAFTKGNTGNITMHTGSYNRGDSDLSTASERSTASMIDEAVRRVGHRLSQRVGGEDSSTVATVDSLGDHPKSAFHPPQKDDRIRRHGQVGVKLVVAAICAAIVCAFGILLVEKWCEALFSGTLSGSRVSTRYPRILLLFHSPVTLFAFHSLLRSRPSNIAWV